MSLATEIASKTALVVVRETDICIDCSFVCFAVLNAHFLYSFISLVIISNLQVWSAEVLRTEL